MSGSSTAAADRLAGFYSAEYRNFQGVMWRYSVVTWGARLEFSPEGSGIEEY